MTKEQTNQQHEHRDLHHEQETARDSRTILEDTIHAYLRTLETTTGTEEHNAELRHITALYRHLVFVANSFDYQIRQIDERTSAAKDPFKKVKKLAHKYLDTIQRTIADMEKRLKDIDIQRDISRDKEAYSTIASNWCNYSNSFISEVLQQDRYIQGLKNWNKGKVKAKYYDWTTNKPKPIKYENEDIVPIKEQLQFVEVWIKAFLETLQNNSYTNGTDFLNKHGSTKYIFRTSHSYDPTNLQEQPIFGLVEYLKQQLNDIGKKAREEEHRARERRKEEEHRARERRKRVNEQRKKEGTVVGWLENDYIKSQIPKFLRFGISIEDLRQRDKDTLLKQLKSGYKKLAKKLHPDVGGSNEAFTAMKEQYEALLVDLTGRP